MKSLFFILIFFLVTITNINAQPGKIAVRTILDDVTTTATSVSHEMPFTQKSFHFFGATSTGAGTATAEIQVSNDDDAWIIKDTLSLTLSASTSSDYYEMDAPWKYTRSVLTAITGTGATVSLVSAEQSRF